MRIDASQRARHAPEPLVQARSLMIETGKPSRAGSVILWFDFCGVPHMRCEWSGEFVPRLMIGDREGYSEVRLSRSRIAASDRRHSQEPVGFARSRAAKELLNKAAVCPGFFLCWLRAPAVAKKL